MHAMHPKKKVLFYFPSLNFYQDPRNWADRFSRIADRFDLGVLALSSASILERGTLPGISIFTLGNRKSYNSSIFRNGLALLSIPKALFIFFSGQFRFDGIVVFNPLAMGLAGLLISRLTGAKLICEVNGNYEAAFKFGATPNIKPSHLQRFKAYWATISIRFMLSRAGALRLLYPTQLASMGIVGMRENVFTCHEFVPVQRFIEATKADGKYVLLVGFPFYLKGVDTLILAFNTVSKNFPEYSLKIVGWCPEGKEYFEALAAGNAKIEICNPVPYDQIVDLMAKCSFLVLPSRTEAMGRVLVEAMACGKPVIGSNVEGIPYVIQHGLNGLLTPPEDVHELAEKMRILITDSSTYQRLAAGALDTARTKFSEAKYGQIYGDMLANLLSVPSVFEHSLTGIVDAHHRRQKPGDTSGSVLCKIAQKGKSRRLLLFFEKDNDKPLYFAKSASNPDISFRKEFEVMQLLGRIEELANTIPTPITYVEEMGCSALVESAVIGQPIHTIRVWEHWKRRKVAHSVDRVHAWWTTLVKLTPRPHHGAYIAKQVDEVVDAFVRCHGSAKLSVELQRILERVKYFGHTKARLSLVHGDLWCGNILETRDGIVIVDWERTTDAGLPLLDILLFLSTLVDDISVKGLRDALFCRNWLSKIACDYLIKACRFLKLSQNEAEDLFIYFLTMMSSQVMRRFGTHSVWDMNWYHRLEFVLENETAVKNLFHELVEEH